MHLASTRATRPRPGFRGFVFPALFSLTLIGSAPAGAKTWAASEWVAIQDALDSAAYGDTVLVAPGTYDRLVLRSGITLMSEKGPEDTILRNGRFWVVKAEGVDSTAVIEGFTLDGIKASEGVAYLEESSLTIRHCVIKNGWSGVRALYSKPRIENCTIRDCQNGVYLYESEGVVLENDIQLCLTAINVVSSRSRILRNTITRNSYGIQVSDHSQPAIGGSIASANRVWNNAAVAVKNTAYITRNAVRTMQPMTLEVPFNFWGTDCPDSSMFQGPVEYAPWVDESGTRSLRKCGAPAGGN
ncbi:MAG: NosD domain-containing protein [bacterium]